PAAVLEAIHALVRVNLPEALDYRPSLRSVNLWTAAGRTRVGLAWNTWRRHEDWLEVRNWSGQHRDHGWADRPSVHGANGLDVDVHLEQSCAARVAHLGSVLDQLASNLLARDQ